MLRVGIPEHRLPREVLDREIEVITNLGVEIKTNTPLGPDLTVEGLLADGYKAVYLALGAHKGIEMGIPGEKTQGVRQGVDFLREVNLTGKADVGRNVVIIGGGNVAIDVARTAVRSGADAVEMLCLESREEMPALEEEIEEALSEDILIGNSWGPRRILAENGRVTGVEFRRCVSVFDEDGRFSPVYDDEELMTVEADAVIVSVGQAMAWGDLLAGSRVELRPNGTVVADPETFQTGESDIFVGGDALTGPKFAIDAIAVGKEGAVSIHRFVQPGQSLVLGRTKRDYRPLDKENLDLAGFDRLPRQRSARVGGEDSKRTFDDLRGLFTEEQIRKETERCLGCGATVSDPFLCVGCGACTLKCRFDAISLERKYDAEGLELFDIRPTVMKHAVKRKLKITMNRPVKALKSAFGG